MLKLYDYLETMLEERRNHEWNSERRLDHFASEVMEMLSIRDEEEIAASIARAIRACDALHIPPAINFKKIYRSDGERMMTDWKISPLACYLVIVNCDPRHECVARAQLFFAVNRDPHIFQ
jgi:DNA-damage-inducible protein D